MGSKDDNVNHPPFLLACSFSLPPPHRSFYMHIREATGSARARLYSPTCTHGSDRNLAGTSARVSGLRAANEDREPLKGIVQPPGALVTLNPEKVEAVTWSELVSRSRAIQFNLVMPFYRVL